MVIEAGVAAGYVVAWAMRKARRVAGQADAVVDASVDAGMDKLAALVQEHCFYQLEAPIERVTGWDTPYPHAQEWAYFPGPDRVAAALKRTMEGR